MSKRIPEPLRNNCRHFRGIQHDTCRAGVVYHEVSKVATEGQLGCALRLPCLYPTETSYPCASLSRYTDEEVEANEARRDKYIAETLPKIQSVRASILNRLADRGETKANVSGEIACAVCGTGTVTYSYAGAYNRHITASCSTEGCVRWKE